MEALAFNVGCYVLSLVSFDDKSPPRLSNNEILSTTRYLLPLLLVFLALQINWVIAPYLDTLPPFLTFIAAIMATTWYGGFRPAMLAISLSVVVIDYYFIDPIYSFGMKPAATVTVGMFILEGIGIAYCIDYLRKNEKKLRQANIELEERVLRKRARLTENEERIHRLMLDLLVTEERERHGLAIELHDYLAQLLMLGKMKMTQAEQSLYRSTHDTSRYIGETAELLSQSLGYVRTLMAQLDPPELKENGLPAALRWLAGQMGRHGLTIELSIERESLLLQHEHAVLLYQSVRELLMNCVKHAEVDRAEVSLQGGQNELIITVHDSGRGFDASNLPPSAAGMHFGLPSIRERMELIGGHFLIRSAAEQGTTIMLTMPLKLSSESLSFRAASASRQEPIQAKATVSPGQQSLPPG